MSGTKGYKWFSTPDSARNRPRFNMTMPREVIERLDAMRGDMPRSVAVEALIMSKAAPFIIADAINDEK